MNSFCLKGQVKCPYHKKCVEELPFSVLEAPRGDFLNLEMNNMVIFFLLKGKFIFSCNNSLECELRAGEMVLLPPASTMNVNAIEDMYAIICSMDVQIQLCDSFSLDLLIHTDENVNQHSPPLHIDRIIEKFLYVLEIYLSNQLYCSYLYTIKINELFHLIKILYSKAELTSFFCPIINKDIFFKELVLRNYRKAQTVSELAEIMRYSVSGFKKKFEKCFHVPVYTWMQKQRSVAILKELKEKKKTLKEIYLSNQFSSQARFYEFCKKYYGKTPSQIRKNE